MNEKTKFNNTRSAHLALVARVVSDWWGQPDGGRIALWTDPGYDQRIRELWQEVFGEPAADSGNHFLSCCRSERAQLAAEYERLFVGPAAPPCPPYESIWRRDRPTQEQGTINGKCTSDVKKIYQSLGLRLRHDQVELADHIAIEMEALACALATSENDSRAGLISDHLSIWFPVFSATLARESLLESYKRLAFLTMECISAIQSGSTEENSAL